MCIEAGRDSDVRDISSPVTDSLVHELRGDGAVHTPTNGPYDTTLWPTNFADARNFLSNKLLL